LRVAVTFSIIPQNKGLWAQLSMPFSRVTRLLAAKISRPLLKLVADEVDWKEICLATLPYSGLRRNPGQVGEFFSDIAKVEDVTVFEPQEFIEAGENVTVLGYLEALALHTKQKFQTEWVHVFTVKNGKITRWRGFTDTAARYGP
jgi:ketosteroid isomerase-like protein